MQIDRRENIDRMLWKVRFCLSTHHESLPASFGLAAFFHVAGASSNEAGMKRLLARISNRHSVPRAVTKGKRIRADAFATKAIKAETVGIRRMGGRQNVGNTFPKSCLQKNSAFPGMKRSVSGETTT